MSEQYFRWRFM